MQTLISFHSTHAAMEAELVGEEAGISCRLVPLPPVIDAGCGLVLLCDSDVSGSIIGLLAARHVPLDGVYDGRPGAWHRRAGN